MQTSSDIFVQYLNPVIPLTAHDVELIGKYFEVATANKNEVLEAYGKVTKYMYFIVSGFVRAYHFENGVEITNHLASAHSFITAYNSFTTKIPSEEVVQTITECKFLKITKDNLNALYSQSHNLALFGIMMSEKYLVFNNQRGKDLITLNAEEKYLKLLKEEPQIMLNVPLQYIASYIGIEPQTLSRIRRNIIL